MNLVVACNRNPSLQSASINWLIELLSPRVQLDLVGWWREAGSKQCWQGSLLPPYLLFSLQVVLFFSLSCGSSKPLFLQFMIQKRNTFSLSVSTYQIPRESAWTFGRVLTNHSGQAGEVPGLANPGSGVHTCGQVADEALWMTSTVGATGDGLSFKEKRSAGLKKSIRRSLSSMFLSLKKKKTTNNTSSNLFVWLAHFYSIKNRIEF